MAQYTMGIDAGGTKVAYGLFDASGRLVRRYEHPTDVQADGPAFSDQMVDTAYRMLEAQGIGPEDVYKRQARAFPQPQKALGDVASFLAGEMAVTSL